MITSEYVCIICALLILILGAFVISGKADGTISVGGFSRTRLNQKFRVKPVRRIKAASLFIAAVLFFMASRGNDSGVWIITALAVLVLADPLMLLCQKD